MPTGDHGIVLGVDVGGTKVAVGQVVGRDVVAGVEHATPLDSGEAVLETIEAGVRQMEQRSGRPVAVGVGVPSQIDFATGEVVASVNIPLHGIRLREELGRRLGVPVVVDNDGNCAALAEAQFTPGGPARYLVMLTLGTGVGGGVVIDGAIFRGATGRGAELGHVVIDKDGPECPGACPNHGCLEALCSGQALGRDALEVARERPDSPLGRLFAENGDCSGRDVVRLAYEKDPDAVGLMERLGTNLGVGIASFINIFEPEHIVIGGGLSVAGGLFMDAAVREARSRALPALVEQVDISLAKAGPAAGLLGAGLLAEQMVASAKRDTEERVTQEGVR